MHAAKCSWGESQANRTVSQRFRKCSLTIFRTFLGHFPYQKRVCEMSQQHDVYSIFRRCSCAYSFCGILKLCPNFRMRVCVSCVLCMLNTGVLRMFRMFLYCFVRSSHYNWGSVGQNMSTTHDGKVICCRSPSESFWHADYTASE